ncbi:amino acid/polyamine/organocation transporter (APC superfamily) [Natranaerovirga pectinivora]|uniref:Amino acid/polyamine/organocation transporter (APC superfamily) n=1 Tax=Natranaerovirga pectinivora TaxID=682400 RepID=A0A4R3MMZ8_9FIRM|nr:amino acid permease [Natranaerovirga pectinivora]TCT16365.1 amino acid/polyamine/organocation transporter (APC superfamily) [Natranaerovirga pectinivora]
MSQTQERLGKNLSFFAVYAIGTGTMIGAGIFVLPGIAIGTAGPAAALSFFIGGLITLATMFSVMELATGMPKAGGSYFFISRSLGPLFGTIVGLGAWMSLVFKGSFALVGLAEYFQVFFTAPIIVVAVCAGVLMLFINYRGSKGSGSLQNIIVGGLIVILFLFIVRGSMLVSQEKLVPFMPYGMSSVFQTTGIIFISYLGVTQLAAISEEVKDPAKNIPRAFLLSVITVIIIYVGVIIVVNGILPMESLSNSNTPLVSAAERMQGQWGIYIITLAGFFATVSTANAAIMSSSRFPFAMARDQLMPSALIKIHKKYKTPYIAILFTGIVMLGLLFFFDVEGLAKLGSTLNVLIFVLVNLSVFVFRKNKSPNYKPTFKDPFFPVTQIVGIVGSLALLPSLGILSLVFALCVIGVGILWYLLLGRNKIHFNYAMKDVIKDTPTLERVNESEIRILVPLANPEHEKDLLIISDALGDAVTGINVITVPEQISPRAAMDMYHKEKSNTSKLLEKTFDEWVGIHKEKQNYVVVFDHSVSNAIIEQASLEDSNMIVMGWCKKEKFKYPLGKITHEILTKAKCHMALLKGNIKENIKKIGVAYDGKPNAHYALIMAKKLAMYKNAEIIIIHVFNPDDSQENKQEMIHKLEDLCRMEERIKITYQVYERYSPVDTILEVEKNTDLMVIGDSNKLYRKSFISRIANRVANHAENPVLVIKRYEHSTKYLKFFE